MDNRIFETYKNSGITHRRHIYVTTADMEMDTMCAYPPSQHTFPQLKRVLRCCYNFPNIDFIDQ